METRRFRWAKCQLDTLAQCFTRGKVRQALKQLPKTLDETYERILRTIDEGQNADEAVKILIWLTYSERPLTAAEVLEVTGIVTGDNPRFDEEELLQDPNDILHVCSSIVSVITSDDGDYWDFVSHHRHSLRNAFHKENSGFKDTYVSLAHFGNTEIVQLLLAVGADVNARERFERNALEMAAFAGHEKVVRLLLAAGADDDAQSYTDGNVLTAAIRGGVRMW